MTQVLVTIGQQLPFDRLIKTADQCAKDHPDWLWVAQTGRGADYQPQYMEAVASLEQDRFDALLAESDLLICHAGIGTIMRALTLAKPVLVMARDASKGEHRNQHQQATLDKLRHLPGIHPITGLTDTRQALATLAPALGTRAGQSLQPAIDIGGADPRLLSVVEGFISEAVDRD